MFLEIAPNNLKNCTAKAIFLKTEAQCFSTQTTYDN